MNKFLLAAMAFSIVGSAAMADTVNMKFTGTAQGRNAKITFGSNTQNVFSGQLKHTISGGTGSAAALNGNWLTFCTDITQHVTSTNKVYDVVNVSQVPAGSPMGVAKAGLITSLYNVAGNNALLVAANTDLASAFQLAVWEIVSDFNPSAGRSSLSITNGWFNAKNTDGSALPTVIANYLTTWFDAIAGGSPVTGNSALVGLANGDAQDQIISVAPPIPAPGSLALAGLGLGLIARRRRVA